MWARYFTVWSVGFLVAALVLAALLPTPVTLGLLLAAMANSLVVSVGGPAVLAFGKVPGTCKQQHTSNLLLHAAPVVLVAVLLARAGRLLTHASLGWALAALGVLDVAWALAPCRGARWDAKVRAVYGVDGPWTWAAGVVVAQLSLVALLRQRRALALA